MYIFTIFLTGLLIIIFNKLFLIKVKNKNLIFTDYLFFFIYFSIIIFIIIFLYINYFYQYNEINTNKLVSVLIIYFLFFICTFLIICTKFTSSPTEIIYNYIKRKEPDVKSLRLFINKKDLINLRIQDLKKQNLIYEKKGFIQPTQFGANFIKYFVYIKNFLKINCEG